jgi:hypothetical protein
MEIGDEVSCYIPGHGSNATIGLVIGIPHFSEGDDVVISNDNALGMPVSIHHCTSTGRVDLLRANYYRARYIAKFPNYLKSKLILAPER